MHTLAQAMGMRANPDDAYLAQSANHPALTGFSLARGRWNPTRVECVEIPFERCARCDMSENRQCNHVY